MLYCVTQPNQTVNVASGVCEGAVQSREMVGVQVYWSEIADPEECLGTAESLKKAALQFHQVLREILAAATPIPFRFPTLLESEDSMEQHLEAEQELYRAALERIGDAVQYEVVGSWAADDQADLATPADRGRVRLISGGNVSTLAGDGTHCGNRQQTEKRHDRLGARVAGEAGAQEPSLVCAGTAGEPRPLRRVVEKRRAIRGGAASLERALASGRVCYSARRTWIARSR